MEYVSGLHALNLASPAGTPGDWHYSALDWSHPFMLDSDRSVFGDWDIHRQEVPGHGVMLVAGHARACLDLVALGDYGDAQGMRDSFLDDDSWTLPVMRQAWKLHDSPRWQAVDSFMGHEYWGAWLDFKQEMGEVS